MPPLIHMAVCTVHSFKRMESYGLDDASVAAVLKADSKMLVLSEDGLTSVRRAAEGEGGGGGGGEGGSKAASQKELLMSAADLLEGGGTPGDSLLTPFQVVLRIMDARVPILKLQHRSSGIDCDMCVDNTLAIRNTRLLRTYVGYPSIQKDDMKVRSV